MVNEDKPHKLGKHRSFSSSGIKRGTVLLRFGDDMKIMVLFGPVTVLLQLRRIRSPSQILQVLERPRSELLGLVSLSVAIHFLMKCVGFCSGVQGSDARDAFSMMEVKNCFNSTLPFPTS